jgi:hypothetical protein
MELDNLKIDIFNNKDFRNYEICKSRESQDCLKFGPKENFKGRVCNFCYNYGRLLYSRKKYHEKKINRLHTSKLSDILDISQMEKLTQMLNSEQLNAINTILSQSINNSEQNIKNNSENINTQSNKSINLKILNT